ncbi:hypothetical protein BD94_2788 [Elizabethkingia anophelis NUHP1]|uniref:Uncharacterized protein n=1 Tax=Elizabethkingia anophelis NUHP1 TaxID=1338011 RepID=A0A077EJ99_9FLAO|nr:hypothetical protein BD94_2788 [Elizabethkingia anophelis NUHP1]
MGEVLLGKKFVCFIICLFVCVFIKSPFPEISGRIIYETKIENKIRKTMNIRQLTLILNSVGIIQ